MKIGITFGEDRADDGGEYFSQDKTETAGIL
jgi:hypothetical protein